MKILLTTALMVASGPLASAAVADQVLKSGSAHNSKHALAQGSGLAPPSNTGAVASRY
jgi:hypothetical protein